ncbi:MAG TPA: cytochrome P450 [Acidimicrobiales bacterium]|nr:cytochrome P450 [Acidimicrobiales bacterium]
MELSDIDLTDAGAYVRAVPHDWFAFLRRNAPVWWHEESDGPGFWCVTKYDDCVAVNRDYETFSSARKATFIWELPDEAIEEQKLMMLNMDPPLHTRYRRLVNKGFTPRMVSQLEQKIHDTADDIIDAVIEKGECDFVTDISSELPLVVIADLLGVPQEDRHNMFDWSNRMIGRLDPEFAEGDPAAKGDRAADAEFASQAAMELYAYAVDLYAKKRISPKEDLMSVLTQVEVEGDQLSELELELFFLLLTVAGNETTRNLMSGAMVAFFDNPGQWEKLRADRSLMPKAVEEMLRYVTPVMNFRRQTTGPTELRGQKIEGDQKVVFFHTSANRDEDVFECPDSFDIERNPNPHMAFGGGGPHFCLGANLARMEIRVMYQHLLDRLPDIRLDGEVQRLQSSFINGVKHIPVAFSPGKPLGR